MAMATTHSYTLSITDPWNGYETEDFHSDSPFQNFVVGDEVDTSRFGTPSKDRVRCRVVAVLRHIGMLQVDALEQRIVEHTVVKLEPIPEGEETRF